MTEMVAAELRAAVADALAVALAKSAKDGTLHNSLGKTTNMFLT